MFHGLLKKREKYPDLFAAYHQVIQDQFKVGIVETAPQISNKPEQYIPHKPVVREKAESVLCMTHQPRKIQIHHL